MDGNKQSEKPLRERTLWGFIIEDVGYGDITSNALVTKDQKAHASLYFKESGVAAGLEEAADIFKLLGCETLQHVRDGTKVEPGQKLLDVSGLARSLLLGERVALNLVSHMSGIATTTQVAVNITRKMNPKIRVAATRKTLPGLRDFEKKAIELGGGDTHRLRLDDCVLIKDNHLELLPSISEAVRLAKEGVSFTKKIEVEVRTLKQAEEAAHSGVDIIMFDNMKPQAIIECLFSLDHSGLRKGLLFEASGGINLENIAEYASTGVDIVSLGMLTHSARAIDVKFEIKMAGKLV